jgi:hypothetical protein
MEHKQPENFDAYEFTKNFIENMTDNERYKLDLELSRNERNLLLEKTDIYLNQNDRYTEQQINEIKKYRQQLRDHINLNLENIKNKIYIPLPSKPDFIK